MKAILVVEDAEKKLVEFTLDDRVIRSLIVLDNHIVHHSEQIAQEILQHDRVGVTA